MNCKTRANLLRTAAAAAGLTLSGLAALAQQPSLTYMGSAFANDGSGGFASQIIQGNDLNPYATPFSDVASARYDLFVGGADKGIFAMGSSSISVSKDDILLTARVRSEVTYDQLPFQPEATGVLNYAIYTIPLTYHTELPFQPWSCTATFVDPAITLHANLGTNVQADFYASLDNGQTTYRLFKSLDGNGTSQVISSGPQSVRQSGTGDETINFLEEVGVGAALNYNPGKGTGAEAILDPGLPVVFSNLSPGLTIYGPDGHIYASSVVPEPSLFAYSAALFCVYGLSRRRRQAKRRSSTTRGLACQ